MNLFKQIISLFVFLWICRSVTISPPVPFIGFDQQLVQTGSKQFQPSMNTTGGDFSMRYTITLTKMQNNLPNAYQHYIGFRGVDMFYRTQTQGLANYASAISIAASTSIQIHCLIIPRTKFIFATFNYLLVHQVLVTNKLIFGSYFAKGFVGPSACTGPGTPVCGMPIVYAAPSTGYRHIVSISHIFAYRNDDLANKNFLISATLQIVDANNINFRLQVGADALLQQILIHLIFISQTLYDSTVKKRFMLSHIMYSTQNTSPFVSYQHSFPHQVYQNSFFMGIYMIYSKDIELKFKVQADSSNLFLNGEIHSTLTLVRYKGIAWYGYMCPDGFYFKDQIQGCELCQNYCNQCVLTPAQILHCIQCDVNFDLSTDKLSCTCPQTLAGAVCDDFVALNLQNCVNAQRVSGNVICFFCSFELHFVWNPTNQKCECKTGYNDNDQDGVCQETCGDGIVFTNQCDDGNTNDNDGCSSSCLIESMFKCDQNQPTYCETLIPLRYKHYLTMKKEQGSNIATIQLNLKNSKSLRSLPFSVYKNQLDPKSSLIKLYLITSTDPYTEQQVTDLTLVTLDQNYNLFLEFEYTFAVEDLDARIDLDYSQTRYLHDFQELKFTLKGSNYALTFSNNLQTYRTFSNINLAVTAVCLLIFIIGLFSPKYIGLELILTLQLIFYSQLLIVDPSKIPLGFMYLKYLRLSTGFNDILTLTQYKPVTLMAKKLVHLQVKKTIIENFNINFVLLFLAFAVSLILFCVRYRKESELGEFENDRKHSKIKDNQFSGSTREELFESLAFRAKVCEKVFYVANHFSLCFLLPLMSALFAQVMLENDIIEFTSAGTIPTFFMKMNGNVGFLSVLIIVTVCMNNFGNVWISQETMKKLKYKLEEYKYKKTHCVYLMLMGLLILAFHTVTMSGIPISVLVLCVQVFYAFWLLLIHPYRQSLRVHSITLILNHAVYIVFLVVVNLINLVNEIDESLVLMLGFIIPGCCALLIILSVVRLYYELRYGEALEREICKERERQEQLEKERQEQEFLKKKKKLQQDAMNQMTEGQRIRAMNQYLYENQVKNDQSKDILSWLQTRNWEPEEKQQYFFKNCKQKPLEWLKANDKQQYQRQIAKLSQIQQIKQQKKSSINQNISYIQTSSRLKKQCKENSHLLYKRMKNHQKRISRDINYSMEIGKNKLEKYIKRDYELKD